VTPRFPLGPHPCNAFALTLGLPSSWLTPLQALCLGREPKAKVATKILSHFIKRKVSMTPMEIVLMIPRELEHLENLIKVARKKKDVEATNNQVSMVLVTPTLR